MIIIMERDATANNIQAVTSLLKEHGFQVIVHEGDVHTVIDALGDKTTLSPSRIDAMDGVKQIKFIREPFRLASRDRKSEDTVIEFPNGVKVGGANRPVFMVGPCSVEEDYDGLLQVAVAAKELGCQFCVEVHSNQEHLLMILTDLAKKLLNIWLKQEKLLACSLLQNLWMLKTWI